MKQGERRLRDGGTVAVHRNAGLRKVCRCSRRTWAKCPHPWHFNFTWRSTPFRFSLDRYEGRPVVSKTDAESLAQRVRDAIRAGTFRGVSPGITSITSATNTPSDVPFEMFGRAFIERYSKERGKASWQDDEYMVKRLASFLAVDGRRLGEVPIRHLTEDDLEAFVRQLTVEGRSASTRNHYVQLIR